MSSAATVGIFTGPDPIADRVIASGDSLFGSTVVGLDLKPTRLNDGGQIAFGASLADGRRVIARAEVVPEPSTFTLFGLGTLALVRLSSRQQKAWSEVHSTRHPLTI